MIKETIDIGDLSACIVDMEDGDIRLTIEECCYEISDRTIYFDPDTPLVTIRLEAKASIRDLLHRRLDEVSDINHHTPLGEDHG